VLQEVLLAMIGDKTKHVRKLLLILRRPIPPPQAQRKHISIQLVGSQVTRLLEAKGVDLLRRREDQITNTVIRVATRDAHPLEIDLLSWDAPNLGLGKHHVLGLEIVV
jgi:hypothetical protein